MRKFFSRKSHSASPSSAQDGSGATTTTTQSSQGNEPTEVVPLGLLKIGEPKTGSSLLDIVAVHGLGGHRIETWTSINKHQWLKEYLPEELEFAQVFTFGYDSKLTFSKSAATLRDFALGLLDELDNARAASDGAQRPLIFIGHSLGGIVIKKAMILALEQQHRYGDILNSTRGIIFLGTPHRGSKLADWTRFSRSIIDIAPLGPSTVRRGLLSDLETNSRTLKDVSESFQHRALKIKIASFYERLFTAPMKGLVVDEASAVLGYPGEEAIPIDTDHTNIAKVDSTDTQQWRSIIGALRRQIKDLELDEKYQRSLPSISVPSNSITALQMRANDVLDPIDFQREVEQRIDFDMCPNTANWIIHDQRFNTWFNSPNQHILWIHGNPGSGKSFLMSFLYRELSIQARSHQGCAAYFASDRITRSQPRSKASACYNSIISQLLERLESKDAKAAEQIVNDMEACAYTGQLANSYQIWRLIRQISKAFRITYILVDSINDLDEWQDALSLLRRLVDEEQSTIKIVISSRSLDTLRELLLKSSSESALSIELDHKTMFADLESLLNWRIRDVDTRGLDPEINICEYLLSTANGSMLLARHQCEELVRQTKNGRVNLAVVLESLPKDVNEHYAQSVKRMQTLPDRQRNAAVVLFLWALFAARQLSFEEVVAATSSSNVRKLFGSDIEQISRTMIDHLCHGMLVLRNDTVCISHGTVAEYMLEIGLGELSVVFSSELKDLDRNHIEAFLATTLLEYLLRCTNPPLSTRTWSRDDARKWPLLTYALEWWPIHAFNAKFQVLEVFIKFMQSPQRSYWWQCWYQTREFRGTYTNAARSLQAYFHSWVDSLNTNDKKRVLDITGVSLPICMMKAKLQIEQDADIADKTGTVLGLVRSLIDAGQWNEAIRIGEDLVDQQSGLNTREHIILSALSRGYGLRGDIIREVETKERCLAFVRSTYGVNSIQAIIALDNLAQGLSRLGQTSVANRHNSEALKLAEDLLGLDHPETITVLANRAIILLKDRQLDEALKIALTALHELQRIFGSGHLLTIICEDNLAIIQFAMGEIEKGRQTRLQAFSTALVNLGHDHHTTVAIFSALEQEFYKSEDFKALAALRKFKMLHFVENHGETDPRSLKMMNQVLLAQMLAEVWTEAKETGSRLLKGLHYAEHSEENDELWLRTFHKTAIVCGHLEEFDKAVELGEAALQGYLSLKKLECEYGLKLCTDLGDWYRALKDWSNVVRTRSLALEVANNIHGSKSKIALACKSGLAFGFWQAVELQAAFTLDEEVFTDSRNTYGLSDKATITALITLIGYLKSTDEKDLWLSLYEWLLKCRALCESQEMPTLELDRALSNFINIPDNDWRPALDALEAKYKATGHNLVPQPQTLTGAEEPARHANLNQSTSSEHDVLLAYLNAMMHHYGLHAVTREVTDNVGDTSEGDKEPSEGDSLLEVD